MHPQYNQIEYVYGNRFIIEYVLRIFVLKSASDN